MSYIIVDDTSKLERKVGACGGVKVKIEDKWRRVEEILKISDVDVEQRLIQAVSIDPLKFNYNGEHIYFVGIPQETGVHGADVYFKRNLDGKKKRVLKVISFDIGNRVYILDTVYGEKNFQRKEKGEWIDTQFDGCSTLEGYIHHIERKT